MIITSLGHQFIKIQAGNTTIAFNPIAKESKLKGSKFGADVALITTNHPDFNGVSELTFGERAPFIIYGPGEYEVKDIFVKGFLSKSKYGGEDKLNTVYHVTMDNINILFLGAIGDEKLSDEAMEQIDGIDILFVPVSKDTLKAAEAERIAVSLEPKLIIPLGPDEDIKAFLKEAGVDKPQVADKLTLKKKDIDALTDRVIILKN